MVESRAAHLAEAQNAGDKEEPAASNDSDNGDIVKLSSKSKKKKRSSRKGDPELF